MNRHRPAIDKNQQIQLQQKLIYYRSEISNYENKLKSLETELKKEKLRNQYLQEKLQLAQLANIEQYEKKIAMLENKLLSYEVALEEEKSQVSMLKKNLYLQLKEQENAPPPSILKLQAFFNYSLIIPKGDADEDLLVIGDFIIDNTGTVPLEDIIICIRIAPKEAGKLSGKIAMKSLKNKENFLFPEQSAKEWAFVHENWKEKIKNGGEYWLRSLQSSKLMPNEQLQFHNFEIRVKKLEYENAIVVDGFVYCKQISNGIPSLNNIIIN